MTHTAHNAHSDYCTCQMCVQNRAQYDAAQAAKLTRDEQLAAMHGYDLSRLAAAGDADAERVWNARLAKRDLTRLNGCTCNAPAGSHSQGCSWAMR